jgi:FAD:protein FMN transferase
MKFLTHIACLSILAGIFPASYFSMANAHVRLTSERGETPMLSLQGEAQGTTYHIRYFDSKNRNFQIEVDSLLRDFDKCLSLYSPDSEISRFNATGFHKFESPYFYPVLKKSLEAYEATEGAFDPTVLPLVEAYGFGPTKTEPNPSINIDSLLKFVGLDLLEFDSLSIRKKNHLARLDLNGIAQGYSVDVISRFFVEMGINRFMVEIGGEIVCRGLKNDGKIWVTGIENPMKPGSIFSTVNLTDRAMTTAGNYRSQIEKDGQVYNHLINPKNGSMEQTSMLSITVFAKDAITADAYDTAFFVMGFEQTKAFVAKQHDMDVYVIYHDGKKLQTYASAGIAPYLKELRQ